ncbi:carboxylate-amine ligase [Nafulsella turpanensis]|uniref:carboxylate-amine ligase n=1 Tax=Nafulsella turpanensis TaxID=1265690 RepID=UPI0003455218|nr:glutamate-cysteine ligase family protein [Nafulsella turpanensis]
MAYRIFEVFGVELEYMIVDRDTLAVKPIADELLKKVTGAYVSDFENGEIDWSNELVNHVLEIKTHRPASSLLKLDQHFAGNVQQINELLEPFNAMLLPSGVHPFMDPFTEMKLWEHEYNEIYNLYNRIFDCRGHGWANLQSTHINLPFQGDEEFKKLHAAIRMLLPVIPALSASTPMLDSKLTGFADARLETYRHNQKKLPIIAGKVVPEAVFSKQAYHEQIFNPIREAIRPYDTENILDQHFLNSRGAIARFDRGAIEIRIIDIQECPAADLAILSTIVEVLKLMVSEKWSSTEAQMNWHEDTLAAIFLDVVKEGENAKIEDKEYLRMFGLGEETLTAGELWAFLLPDVRENLSAEHYMTISKIIGHGTLSNRIKKALGEQPDKEKIIEVYRQLANCLQHNHLFV